MTNTNWSEVFQILWEFVLQVINFMSVVWDFLTTRITIGFDVEYVDIPVIGDVINWFIDLLNEFSFSFVPIYAFSGIVLITMLTLYLIKSFIPAA